jgi:hypothetical protein
MDYTTLAQTKSEIRNDPTITTDDTLLAMFITAASRAIDRKVTGQYGPDSDNYFMLETRTAEMLPGLATADGRIVCYPHKPMVASVASFAYAADISQTWNTIAPTLIDIWGNKVIAYPAGYSPICAYPGRCRVQITYTGGISGSTAGLPADLIELCSLLAARFYHESETGLTDAIGVADLTTMTYTKAWPVRLVEQLQPYIRKAGWNYL